MFQCMRKHNFNQTESVETFKKACQKKGVKMPRSSAYKWYDKVAEVVNLSASYQQNMNQFFTDLTRLSSKATNKYMRVADNEELSGYALDEALRVMQLQKEALNLQQGKAGDNNNIFMQFLQQNNNQEVNINETIQSIQEGLGEFGPILQRLAGAKMDSSQRAIPVVHTSPETEDTM